MKKIEAMILSYRGALSPLAGVPVRLPFEDAFRIPDNCDKIVTKSSTFQERSYNEL